MDNLYPRGAIFQQDNAPAHTSKASTERMMDHSLIALPWPARSPDANPIENLWAVLARQVYANGRQYDHEDYLKDALYMAWDDISFAELQSLADSMPSRCSSIVEKHVGPTLY